MEKTDADNWRFYSEWLARHVAQFDGWEKHYDIIRLDDCRIVPREELIDPSEKQFSQDPDCWPRYRTVISSELLEEYALHAAANPLPLPKHMRPKETHGVSP